MGLCGSDLCECGKVQTAHHILHDCTKFKPPCHINEVYNPAILEYLTQSKFWPTCIPVHVYERSTIDSAVYLLLLTQSLVWLSSHTHRNVMSQQKYGQIINCGLTILIVIGVRGGERGGGCRPPVWKISGQLCFMFFIARTSCSKILNVKCLFITVKNFRATPFFRASAKLLKNLNNKKYFNRVEKFQGKLRFSGQAQVAKKSWMINYIAVKWKISEQLCFPGQVQIAQKSWTVKNFSIQCIQCILAWG